MYKIAICDDDKRYRKTIREIVEHENSLPENEIRFYEYESGNELLKHTDILHELVFIDIRMPGLDGNQTALKLRNYNKDGVLIFCSSYFEPTVDSINFGQPFRYIMKDLHDTSLRREIAAIMTEVKRRFLNDYAVTVTSAGKIIRIHVENILYGLERKYTAKSVEFNIQTDRGNLSLRGYLGPIIWEGFFPEISNNENSKGYLFHPTIQTVDGEANYDCYINTVYSNSLASEIKKTERYIKRQENVASKMQQQILNIRCSQELLSKLNFSLKCKKEYHPLLLEELLDLRTESEIENIFDNFSQEYIQYSVEMRKKYWHKQYYSI